MVATTFSTDTPNLVAGLFVKWGGPTGVVGFSFQECSQFLCLPSFGGSKSSLMLSFMNCAMRGGSFLRGFDRYT